MLKFRGIPEDLLESDAFASNVSTMLNNWRGNEERYVSKLHHGLVGFAEPIFADRYCWRTQANNKLFWSAKNERAPSFLPDDDDIVAKWRTPLVQATKMAFSARFPGKAEVPLTPLMLRRVALLVSKFFLFF